MVYYEEMAAGTNRRIHRFFNLSEYPVHQRNIDGLWKRVKITMSSRYSGICIADPGKPFRIFDSPQTTRPASTVFLKDTSVDYASRKKTKW